MMNQAKEILAYLQAEGVKLSVVDGGLEVKAAKGKINPATLDMLRRHKVEIIDLLTGAALAGSVAPPSPLPPWCRAGCPSFDVIPGAGNGCVRILAEGPWLDEWRRIETMTTCPKLMH